VALHRTIKEDLVVVACALDFTAVAILVTSQR